MITPTIEKVYTVDLWHIRRGSTLRAIELGFCPKNCDLGVSEWAYDRRFSGTLDEFFGIQRALRLRIHSVLKGE